MTDTSTTSARPVLRILRHIVILIFASVVVTLLLDSGRTATYLQRLADRNPVHVLIIGDSVTIGLYATSEAATYRSQLATMLRRVDPQHDYLVDYEGVCTLAGLESYWPERESNPDILFVELGTNDASGWSQCPQVPKDEWRQYLAVDLDRIQADLPATTIVIGTLPWLGYTDVSSHVAEQYNTWIRAEAERRDIHVADLWSRTVGRRKILSSPSVPSPFGPAYRGDGRHPGDYGHLVIARILYDAVKYP